MALFALWRETAETSEPDQLHPQLLANAHIVPELAVSRRLAGTGGAWRLSAFATTTRYYRPHDQMWIDPVAGQACLIHGLIWQNDAGRPRLLDAAAVAALLDRPGRALPTDICGEYAIARLHACGTLTAFSDPSGLHQLFHDPAGEGVVANRAGFVATIRGDWSIEPQTGPWLTAIGYRVGEASGYRAARSLPQGEMLLVDAHGDKLQALPGQVIAFPERRGFAEGGDALLEQGLVQARAAVLLAAGDAPVSLPITGGKDSRAVLAICLAAGLRDQLRLFTRGFEGHPDVVAGRAIAEAIGVPHERQPPLGSDLAPNWSAATFVDNMAAQAFQTEGMMGGWDFILGRTAGTDTLVTGHMGEVLKAYSKRPMAEGSLDPVEMVRLQAPFDPLNLLRPDTLVRLRGDLERQMARAAAEGATSADQPDIFYFRNRVPNWLGGIRGIKSFERQPVMPLGVPALLRLAFTLTPEERKMERVHFEIVRRCAPELIAPAFALQRWDARLAEPGGWSFADPVMPAPSAPPVFGTWQYSLNHVPRLRTTLMDILSDRTLGIWDAVDPVQVQERLRTRTFNYFDGISLLGLAAAVFHEAGIVRPVRMGAAGTAQTDNASDAGGRPLSPDMQARNETRSWPVSITTLHGHCDRLSGAVAMDEDGWRLTDVAPEEPIILHGWLHAPETPGARPFAEARVGETVVGGAVADRPRPDLARAGLDDGAHGFAIPVSPAAVRAAAGEGAEVELTVTAFDSDGFVPIGGRMRLRI